MDEEISLATPAIESVHTLTAECDSSPMLCPCIQIDISLAEDREIECTFHTQGCLCWRDMDAIVEISSLTHESTLFSRDCERDIEISVSIISFISVSSDFDRHPIIDPFGDLDRFFYLGSEIPLAMTIGALVDDTFSATRTRHTWTSLFYHTEHGLYSFSHLPVSMTGVALFGLTSSSTTVMTRRRLVVLDLASCPEDSVLE